MNLFTCIFCDGPRWQIGIQTATPSHEGMIFFYNHLMFFLILIGIFVFFFIVYIVTFFNLHVNIFSQIFTHSSLLEIIWTIIPAIILVFVAMSSFTFFDTESLCFDSYMLGLDNPCGLCGGWFKKNKNNYNV